MGRNPHFTDEQKSEMLALYIELDSFSAVGKRLGLPRQSIKQVIDRELAIPEVMAEYEVKKKSFNDRFEKRAEHLIGEALDALEKELADIISGKRSVKLSELTTAIGTLYDKRALIKGESTENTSVQILLPKEAEEYSK